MYKEYKKKYCLVFSTRPEIIKLYPIIKELKNQKKSFFIINTGQHFNFEMHSIFFKELKLKKAKYNFKIYPNISQIKFISKSLIFISDILKKEKPTHVIVQGDTNTALIGALATSIINRDLSNNKRIELVHVESGLRSFDNAMPEEINRKIIDNLSNILLVPTKFDLKNIKLENLKKNKKVYLTGNTIVDSINQILRSQKNKKKKIYKNKYFLLTLHRPETVDEIKKFKKLLMDMNIVGNKFNCHFIYPIHPRSKKKLSNSFQKQINNIKIIEPINYISFLELLKNCLIVFTDSGGVQEESFILNKPCITIRENTERQTTTLNNNNIIAGYKLKNILLATKKLINKKIKNKPLLGKVGVSKRILNKI